MGIENNLNNEKESSKKHFLNLVQIAGADGVINKSELELLHSMGKHLGFSDSEIDEYIQKRDSKKYTPPIELVERFHLLYDVVSMALADGVLFKNEMLMIKQLAAASGFNDHDSEHIINLLINGIKYKKTEEELFLSFKQRKV
ncbi:MAG: TerB family tellurite resistance protein [Bacteroidales bacterium]|nr:TerB family tellurite resistance protein [Bacteroidales bacterium]